MYKTHSPPLTDRVIGEPYDVPTSFVPPQTYSPDSLRCTLFIVRLGFLMSPNINFELAVILTNPDALSVYFSHVVFSSDGYENI